ncbi:MAG: zinc-ribbon domain-containing protein, partial [Minicystis sp.]
MSKIPCSSCGTPNEEGTRFCTRCGQSQEAKVYCPSCNQPQGMGNRFCMSCGATMTGARFQPEEGAGAVVGGVWERAAGEFIRRVDPEDCRSFLGARVVRIPPGTVGVVMIDGLVERVLPPGEQTTLNLFERLSTFFTARSDRTAFYLVDQRPIPVPFAVETRAGEDGRVVQTQVVVSFSLQRGDKTGLASFIANVLGGRASFSARDLYDLLRPEVRSGAALVLERLARQGTFSDETAEAEIRRELEGTLARYGLTLSVSVAPLTSTRSLSFHLGTGEAPELRPCVKCQAELPAAMKFCDRCGERQPAVVSPARSCAKCHAKVPAGDTFCSACGQTFAEPPASASPLF